MPGSALQRREVHYSGHVQGVGFRYTVRSIADRYAVTGHAVTGYVLNLPDRRVQLVAEAEATHLNRFLDEVAQRLSHHIADIQIDKRLGTGEFTSFQIRH